MRGSVPLCFWCDVVFVGIRAAQQPEQSRWHRRQYDCHFNKLYFSLYAAMKAQKDFLAGVIPFSCSFYLYIILFSILSVPTDGHLCFWMEGKFSLWHCRRKCMYIHVGILSALTLYSEFRFALACWIYVSLSFSFSSWFVWWKVHRWIHAYVVEISMKRCTNQFLFMEKKATKTHVHHTRAYEKRKLNQIFYALCSNVITPEV